MKNPMLKFFINLIFALLICSYASAQDKGKYTYILYNNTNVIVPISISTDLKTWEPLKINAYTLHKFENAQNKMYINIDTEMKINKKSVQYTIYSDLKYQIYWNSSQQQWDLSQYK